MALLISRYLGDSNTLLTSQNVNVKKIREILEEEDNLIFLCGDDKLKNGPLKKYLSGSSIRITLRQFEGGHTIDINCGFTVKNGPVAFNHLARREHQRPLFFLLSLCLNRCKMVCPEDVLFMILNHVTQKDIINGRFWGLDFIVRGGF
jgi:hypothetical protein